MIKNDRFMELVKKENGFEFCQAFRDELDRVISGRENTCWFTVLQDQSVRKI